MNKINLSRFLTEPLLQFLILGGMLYVVVSFIQLQKEKQPKEIVVDGERVALMVSNYRSQTGELPTKHQLDAMIEDYIKEEISFREAKKMGLDKDDEIIRRRLSQKFDFVRNDLIEVQEPDEKQLQEFYKTHLSLFQTESSVSFSHIFFSTDHSADSVAKRKALTLLQQLKGTSIHRAPEKGDRFALQYDYTEQTALDIRGNFGDKPIVDSLFKSNVGNWVGPVQSGYGWHLLYILKRTMASPMLYESNKKLVKEKYMEAAREAEHQKTLQELSKNYIVRRTYLMKQ